MAVIQSITIKKRIFRRLLSLILGVSFLSPIIPSQQLYASIQDTNDEQELVTESEAEDGDLTGVSVQTTNSGYSGTGYVANFSDEGDQVTMHFNLPDSGLYEIRIWYGAFSGKKTQDMLIDGEPASSIFFPASTSFTSVDAGTYLFRKGPHSVTIRKNWGYMAVDKIQIFTASQNVFNIDKELVDPIAGAAAKDLYEFLKTQFGERIISGQTISHFDELVGITGSTPMLRVGDLSSYTEGYPYLWKDGGHTFGATDDGTVADLINWHTNTDGRGIVSLQWHWHSPSGADPGNNNFYTEHTDFDVREAVIPGTEEYDLILRDIDAIAVQLKRFSDAGVPVLWRPLHEAGGGWFWWGAHGPEACLELYDIMYKRLVFHHHIHNLIWVWSTPEDDWYPGHEFVDIIGYDSYPGEYNYGAQKYWFDRLYDFTEGKKLIAMTENGPVPDPDESFTMEAPWLFFMSWSNLVASQNDSSHLQSVYSHPKVITLESENELWRSSLYPDTWYPGYKDSEGRFYHDFSYAGYHQGEKEIPESHTLLVDVTAPPYNADNTGVEDVTTILQQALDEVGQAGGGVVYLPAGTYRIREASSTADANAALHMKYDSVVLRGAGPDATFILHDQMHLRQKDVIHVRKAWSNWDTNHGTITNLRFDLPEPTKLIPVESVEGFAVGDLVVLRTYMTTAFAREHLMEGVWDNTWLDGVMFLRRIDSIDVENNFLMIDIPTRYFMKTRDNARVYHAGPHIAECGIEGLSLGNIENTKTGWGDNDYGVSGTGAYDVHGSHLIQFKYAENCWVKHVNTYQPESNTGDFDLLSNGLVMNMSRNITVDSCDFEKPQYEGGGGNGYMFTLNGNDCLVQYCRANDSRHNFDFKFSHSNGNVILQCRGENSRYSSDFHMYLSMSNLFDGFIVNGDYLECKFRPYGGEVLHGYPSTQSVFYNTYGEAYHTNKNFIVESRQFDWGVITGTSGPADGVRTSPLSGSQGGYSYDTSPADLAEGVGKGEFLRPVSLYKDQFERRQSGYTPRVKEYNVAVQVADDFTGALLKGASVTVNDSVKRTDDGGTAIFNNIPEVLEYSVEAENYVPSESKSAVIYNDTVFYIALEPIEYDVQFKLLDAQTGDPFWGAAVIFNGVTNATDASGIADYTIPGGVYNYKLEKLSYRNDSGEVEISSDTLFIFYMTRTAAYMKYRLTKESAPVNNAYVKVGEDSILTGNLGIALFESYPVENSYSYTVRKDGLEPLSGELYLVTDTTLRLEMASITDTTGIALKQNEGVRIWPNPAIEGLNLEFSGLKIPQMVSIYDVNGSMVQQFQVVENTHYMHVGDVPKGVYIVTLTYEDFIVREKLLIQ